MKEAFATEVVENSGTKPTEVIKDPAGVLGEYWYTNLKEAVDFLDDAVAVNGMFLISFSHADGLRIYKIAEELRRGLRALQFQDSVVDTVCARTPNSDWLGHRDIFNWGEKLVTTRLLHNS